jgi:hypothetical protein
LHRNNEKYPKEPSVEITCGLLPDHPGRTSCYIINQSMKNPVLRRKINDDYNNRSNKYDVFQHLLATTI